MKLPLLCLPLAVTAYKTHTKQISEPFSDDSSITIISPEPYSEPSNTHTPLRHLQNSNDASLQDITNSPSNPSQSTKTIECDESQALWILTLNTDNNPMETKWMLKQVVTNKLVLEGPSSNQEYAPNSSYSEQICVEKGYKYVFRITDSGGDGMCCENGKGGYTISVDGKVFLDRAERDANWNTKSFLFNVGIVQQTLEEKPTRRPTSRPTKRPTGRPTKRPTRRPTRRPTPRPTSRPTVQEAPDVSSDEGVAVSFVLMADIPYYTNHKYCLNEQLRQLNPSEMEQPYSFIIHLGDLKSGQTRDCVNEYYSDVADIFAHSSNSLYYDTRDCFFLIGDNEWCDCNDPGSSFSYWMNNFGNGNKYNWINKGPNPNGFGTFSNSSMRQTLEYDEDGSDSSSSYYPSSASNFAFFINKVLFVGINQVGGAELGDESTRVRNNYQWVKSKMEQYAEEDMRTLVVFAHAPMSGARWQYFGRPFQSLLRDNYPDMLVLYAHGDGHIFNLNRIDMYNPNLYQMECDSGDLGDPLLISIIRNGSARDGLNVDRRGGTYSGGDCNPENRDKTWSSNMF